MRRLFSFLVLALLGVVEALSSSGRRLLIVVEETAEKAKYSTFWGDLEGLSTVQKEYHRALLQVNQSTLLILW